MFRLKSLDKLTKLGVVGKYNIYSIRDFSITIEFTHAIFPSNFTILRSTTFSGEDCYVVKYKGENTKYTDSQAFVPKDWFEKSIEVRRRRA